MKGFRKPNISMLVGIISTAIVAGYTALHASENPLIYINIVGLIIVL